MGRDGIGAGSQGLDGRLGERIRGGRRFGVIGERRVVVVACFFVVGEEEGVGVVGDGEDQEQQQGGYGCFHFW